MTEIERKIVEELNHPLYTPEFIADWEGWSENPMSNVPAALQAMASHGFMEAVKQIAKQQKTEENKNEQAAAKLGGKYDSRKAKTI